MSAGSIMEALDRAGYHTFCSALQATGHSEILNGEGPFTVFAPSDAAFEKFSVSMIDDLLHGDDDKLRSVIGYHLADGKVVAAQFSGKRIRAVMRAGGDVLIDGRSQLRANGARVIAPDLHAANGVIHGVDSVLWPPSATAALGAA